MRITNGHSDVVKAIMIKMIIITTITTLLRNRREKSRWVEIIRGRGRVLVLRTNSIV